MYTETTHENINSEAGVEGEERRHRFREPTSAERTELNETLGELLDALALENAIARARRSEPDAAGRTRRIGRNVGLMVRQLRFWEGKGALANDVIYKSDREWYEVEGGLTRSQLESATRVGVEEGLFEISHVIRPSDRRRVTGYRLNLLAATRIACESERDRLVEVLQHEKRPKHYNKAAEKLDRIYRTLRDLNLDFRADEDEGYCKWGCECDECKAYDGGDPCNGCFGEGCGLCMDDEGEDHETLNQDFKVHNLDTLNCSTSTPSTAHLTQTTEENPTRSRQESSPLQGAERHSSSVDSAHHFSSNEEEYEITEDELFWGDDEDHPNVTEEDIFPSRDKPTSVAEDDGEEEIEVTEEDLDAIFDASPFHGARRR